ncbi:MAG: S8 family serine peptidase [Candidatus Nitronauta litoralis]|uniref:S8 family serine peptidase n=1 Tax=Candidatus Nitronauta litoralis TaxID=2705533 RepID=A0A7T0G178_9BACT|nr:MAG: S8 family serine peptidase [Candidatus Nitronauta litoralis]
MTCCKTKVREHFSFIHLIARTLTLFLTISLLIPQVLFAANLQNDLMSKAQTEGTVRIIARLNTSMPNSPMSPGSDGRAYRSAISNTQQDVLNSLSGLTGANSKQPLPGIVRPVKGVKKFRYHPLLALEADSATLLQLSADPRILEIIEDVPEPPNLSQSIPLIGADTAWTMGPGYTGNGWAVAILDTGVDKTHNFLSGKVVSEACYSTTSGSTIHSVCPGGVQASTAVGSGVECSANNPSLSVATCDHGTHVAGIAAGDGASFSGVAREADIIAIQVFSRFDSASTCSPRPAPCVLSYSSDQIMGLERVLALSGTFNIASANMSLGGGSYSSNCDAVQSARKAAIDNLRAVGIATAISSGNSGFTNAMGAPACISTAVSVGSTTKSDNVSSFSNSASFLSLLAPGSSIRSSIPPSNGFAFFSGTSMAAPHVAGTWAIMRQANPTATVTEILTALQTTGQPILDTRNGLTHPRIQVDAAVTQILSAATLNFASASSSHPESSGTVNVNVNLSQSLGSTATVDYTVTGGSATGGGTDYTLSNGTLTFNPGQTTRPIPININNDGLAEGPETVEITLFNPVNAGLGGTTVHTLTILDDDTLPSVAFDNPTSSFVENQIVGDIPVVLSNSYVLPVSINYAVTGGTATGGGTDYTLAAGILNFIPGETQQSIILDIQDDAIAEAIVDETVEITLAGPSNATIGAPALHTATISDDDLPFVTFLSFQNDAPESQETVNLKIKMSNPAEYPVNVIYYSIPGNATDGTDYTLPPGSLDFAPGQTTATIPLTLIDDTVAEGLEYMFAVFFSVTGAQQGTIPYSFTLIHDDDLPPTVGFPNVVSSGPEFRQPSQIPVTLSNPFSSIVTVDYTVTGGTATAGTDFILPSGTLTFYPGDMHRDIVFSPILDGLGDAGETIEVTLSSPTNATVGPIAAHTYTLTESFISPTNLFVGDVSQSDLFAFEANGALEFNYGAASPVTTPLGMAFHPVRDSLTVTDASSADVVEIDANADPKGSVNQTAAHLADPVGIAYHPTTHDMFVLDRGNLGNVHVFDEHTGVSLGVFGQTLDRLFDPQGGIVFHPVTNNLLVSDFSQGMVLEFDGTTGAYLGFFGETPFFLTNPMGMAFHPVTGNLLVVDQSSGNVVEFDGPTGAHIGPFGQTGNLTNPQGGIGFQPSTGNLFVVDATDVREFDGATGADFGPFGSTAANLVQPSFLSFYGVHPGSIVAHHPNNWEEIVTATSLAANSTASLFVSNSGDTPINYSVVANEAGVTLLGPVTGTLGPRSTLEIEIQLDLATAGINSGNVVRNFTITNTTNGSGNSVQTLTFIPDSSL